MVPAERAGGRRPAGVEPRWSAERRKQVGPRQSAERFDYEARQAELLASLISGTGYPCGFVPGDAAAASQALRAKRRRLVAAVWPALTAELGEAFAPRFDAYASAGAGPPDGGGAVADGLAFAATLEQRPTDPVRVEIAFARALVARRRGRPVLRRGFFLAATRLREPRRLLLIARAPGRAPHHLVVRLGG